MLKKVIVSILVISALVAVLVVFRHTQDKVSPQGKIEFTATDQHRRPLSFAIDSDGLIRAIYTVVDVDGVHFGERRVDFQDAVTYLDATAKIDGIRAVLVCITDSARYGDAARFYIGINKYRYYVRSFPTHSVPAGYRLPVIGELCEGDDSWFDKVSGVEIYGEYDGRTHTPAPFDSQRLKTEPNKALVPTATSVTPAADAPVAPAAAAAHL